jgi:hypothetical protein
MHIDDPHNTGVDEFPTALINAEETAREALAEKTDGTERVAIRLWLRPTLGAILLLACASGIAYKVISGYRHALPEAFVSVQDQNKWAAASAANNPGAPASAGAAAPPKSTAVAAQTAPLSAAPPAASAHDLDGAASGAAEAELSEQENPECAGIKTEQHEIDAALHKPYSPEQGRFMQRRLHELSEQLSQRKCSG